MNLIRRVAWYSGGFIIGIIVLMFFLGGKRASCDYGPTARTLKNIRSKQIVLSSQTHTLLTQNYLDSNAIYAILKNGEVIFSESNTSLDSCNIYVIKGATELKLLKFTAENCNKTVTIENLEVLDQD